MYVSNFFLFVEHSRNVSILRDHSRHSRIRGKSLVVILVHLSIILQILSTDLVSCLLRCLSFRMLTILTFALQVTFFNLSSFTLPVSSLLSSLWSHYNGRNGHRDLCIVFLDGSNTFAARSSSSLLLINSMMHTISHDPLVVFSWIWTTSPTHGSCFDCILG